MIGVILVRNGNIESLTSGIGNEERPWATAVTIMANARHRGAPGTENYGEFLADPRYDSEIVNTVDRGKWELYLLDGGLN